MSSLVASVEDSSVSDVESVTGSAHDVGVVEEVFEVEDAEQAAPLVFGVAAQRALSSLDDLDLESEFITRTCVMKSVRVFLKGIYRSVMRFVLIEADRARDGGRCVGSLPRMEMVLFSSSKVAVPSSTWSRSPVFERVSCFASSQWSVLLKRSRQRAEQAAVIRRRDVDDM